MRKYKKYISSILALLLMFNFLMPSVSLAKNSKYNLENEKVVTYDFREYNEKDTSKVRAAAVGAVTVFVAGYLVGKIIDGVFIVATGKTLENHMLDFIMKVYKNNTHSGITIRVKYGCGYAPGQPYK